MIAQFHKEVRNILLPLEDEINTFTRSIQKHMTHAEEDFERIVDAAYPTCTEVHPYLARAPPEAEKKC